MFLIQWIRAKMFVRQEQKKLLALKSEYRRVAPWRRISSHKSLRMMERWVDEKQDEIYSLTV